jgi:hypothetical protein
MLTSGSRTHFVRSVLPTCSMHCFDDVDGFHNLSDVLAIAIALQCERLKQSDGESCRKTTRCRFPHVILCRGKDPF